MLRRTVIALSLVALLGGVRAAYAQGMQPGHRAHGMARMQQRLGLTDDQMTAIRAAYQKHRDEQKQTWQGLAARVKVLQEIGPILTPEQREKLAQASPHRGMHRHHRKPPTQS